MKEFRVSIVGERKVIVKFNRLAFRQHRENLYRQIMAEFREKLQKELSLK